MYGAGQIPGCLYWGWNADKYGRKKSLIIVLLGSIIVLDSFQQMRS